MPLAMKILAKHANVRGVLLGPRTMYVASSVASGGIHDTMLTRTPC